MVAPPEEVAAGPRGLDAQLAQLSRGEAEERIPGRDFGGVLGELAADEGEEGGGVGDEGRWLRNGWEGERGVESSGALAR